MLYLLVTVVALDYLHDAWFYWTHCLLHSRALYKRVHSIHHRCIVTAPPKNCGSYWVNSHPPPNMTHP